MAEAIVCILSGKRAGHLARSNYALCILPYTNPWPIIASAIFRKLAMFAPATRL